MVRVYFQNKSIVLPGDLLLEGKDITIFGSFYREGNKYFSKSVALFEVKNKNTFKVTPLVGSSYIPKVGDFVIGFVEDVGLSGWLIDIRSCYKANLPLREAVDEFIDIITQDLSKYYDYGDVVALKIINVPKSKLIQASTKGENLGKLEGGRIIEVPPCKVPRIIGKNATMINMMKQVTGAKILVGQNGRIWIKHKDPKVERVLARAIVIIDKESHLPGLTERIKEFLEKNIKNEI